MFSITKSVQCMASMCGELPCLKDNGTLRVRHGQNSRVKAGTDVQLEFTIMMDTESYYSAADVATAFKVTKS